MAKSTKRLKRPKRHLAADDFWAENHDTFAELLRPETPNVFREPSEGEFHPNPFMVALRALSRTGFRRLLQSAKRQHNSEAFKDLVKLLLLYLRVDPLTGVFVPSPEPAGAPKKALTLEIYKAWLEKKQLLPPAGEALDELTKKFYPEDWAHRIRRKKARDRVRTSILRSAANDSATKSGSVS
jgi:hypothetical protein